MIEVPQALNDFAGLCLRTSLDAVWIGLAALALSFTRLWTPRMRLFVVGLALVRLIVPVVPEVPFHPGSFLPEARLQAVEMGANDGFGVEEVAALAGTNVVAADLAAQSAARKHAWTSGLAMLWIGGVALAALWLAGSQIALSRRMRLAEPVHDARLRAILDEAADELGMGPPPPLVRVSDWGLIALVGAWNPRLAIPDDFSERFSELESLAIFKHELAHLKRRDLVWNWLFTMICSLHWFNPLAWLLFHRWRTDVELRCDEIALRGFEDEERHRYGHALVSMLQTLNAPGPSASVAPLFHHKLNLKHRMKMIVNPNRYSRFTQAVAALVVGLLAAFSLTRAQADGESPRRPNVPREGQRQIRPGVQRDGEAAPRPGVRREGDGAPRPGVPREGDRNVRPSMLRDGEGAPRPGVRRDGEGMPRPGVVRDGEGAPRPGVRRDGEGGVQRGPRDGGGVSREGQPQQQGIMIRVNARGQVIAGDNRPVPIETVRATLKKLAAGANGRPIVIKADQGMPTASLKALIEECEKAGVKNVSFSGSTR